MPYWQLGIKGQTTTGGSGTSMKFIEAHQGNEGGWGICIILYKQKLQGCQEHGGDV